MTKLFLDVIFPSDLTANVKRSIEFSTTVNQTNTGYEFRQQRYREPKYRYEIIGDTVSLEDFKKIENLFIISSGMALSFLFIDNFDKLDQDLISISDGETLEFEIFQQYTYVDNIYKKNIFDIFNDVVFIDNIALTPDFYSISNGFIRFKNAIPIGKKITISGFPLRKVRFSKDTISAKTINSTSSAFESIFLEEIF